jgi:hypothetical protein
MSIRQAIHGRRLLELKGSFATGLLPFLIGEEWESEIEAGRGGVGKNT